MDHETQYHHLRNNPFFVITVAVLVAIIMILLSTYMYLRSDTRQIVEQIQVNNSELIKSETDNSIIGEFSPEMIDAIESNIRDDITSLNTDADYNPDELTDSSLGL